VEELDGFRDTVLNEHAVSVAGNQASGNWSASGWSKGRWFLVAQLGDRDLAQGAFVVSELDLLIQNLWGAEGAGQRRQRDPVPSRSGWLQICPNIFGAPTQR